jgi:hypothetical protein
MLGIEGTSVWLAYLLCLASVALCIIFGAIGWNKGDEPVEPADVKWAQEQKKEEEEEEP